MKNNSYPLLMRSMITYSRWLSGTHVELPQYADHFRRHGVNGSRLPQVAVSTGYLAKVVGVTNAIHRSKITLKAMDVVLFGPPKSDSNPLKDLVLTTLLLAAVTGLVYAYRQNRKSQLHLKKVNVSAFVIFRRFFIIFILFQGHT